MTSSFLRNIAYKKIKRQECEKKSQAFTLLSDGKDFSTRFN
jgi:hypothetical protein